MDPATFIGENLPRQFAESMEHLEVRIREYEEKARAGDEGATRRLEEYRRRLANAKEAVADFQVEISGAGDPFLLRIEGGRMTVSRGTTETPVLALRQDLAHFTDTIERGVGARFSLFGQSGDGAARPRTTGFARLLAPSLISMIREARTSLRFCITDRPGGDWKLDVGFGAAPGEAPACTISVAEGDYQQIAAGTLAPQQAFFGGKVKIAGDMSILLRLGAPFMGGG